MERSRALAYMQPAALGGRPPRWQGAKHLLSLLECCTGHARGQPVEH
jgi:hypothetical protein